ncbi:MAG: hypothetical protein ABF562_11540 [Gluconobacter japonicus]|nr:hypothetical protein [Gluconobacter japonicus]
MDGLDDVSNRFYDHALICQIGIILVAPQPAHLNVQVPLDL